MEKLTARIKDIKEKFAVTDREILRLSQAMGEEMKKGMEGTGSSLKMIPSYLGSPAGQERGEYLALDFGGTNVRILLVELLGEGRFIIKEQDCFSLRGGEEEFDCTAAGVTGRELFRFIAGRIKRLAARGKARRLGFTFSYPFCSEGQTKARLLCWTKELAVSGVVGEDVGKLMTEALREEGLSLGLGAVINDTVGTQLARAYESRECSLAAILGTGFNTCYLEKRYPGWTAPVIVNMETGNFNGALQNTYDQVLDKGSESPGSQQLEKMLGGRYLGELVRLILLDLVQDGLIFAGKIPSALAAPFSLGTEVVGGAVDDKFDRMPEGFARRFNTGARPGMNGQEEGILREFCKIVLDRAASLAVAALLGIVYHMDPALQQNHLIAVDGSLYEKMPFYRNRIQTKLASVLGRDAGKVKLTLTKEGSGIGAAIAAAMTD